MKQTITGLLLLGILFFTGISKAQVADPAAINVYSAVGTITVDGNLNEADWSANLPTLMFKVGGTPSGVRSTPTGSALVKGPYRDTSTCFVKFLKKGTNLYISLNSDDKQVCRFGDSWEGDGLFMKIQNSAGTSVEFKLYYNLAGPNPEMHYEGGVTSSGMGVKKAGTIVSDSTNTDAGYTGELMIDLTSLGFTANTSSVQVIMDIFDPDDYNDGNVPWGPNGNFTKQFWGSEWGNPGDAYRTLTLLNQPLPVELTSFTAASVKEGVKLNWVTATETNNRGFEIQRSYDKSNFATVGFVEGKGTSVEKNTYTYVDKNVTSGVCYYRLRQVDLDGTFSLSNVAEVNSVHNMKYELVQNFPNPFNPSTTIRYSIPDDNLVSLKVFDVLGNEVATLVNEQMAAGQHDITFNAASLSSGIYYYTIKSGNFAETKKFILMK